VLALAVTIPGLGHAGAAQQAPAPATSTLRVLRGVVTADGGAPLMRVRVLVSAPGLSADPVFTNELGAFDVHVPAATAYTLTLTKPGFARQELRGAGDDSETPLRIRLERGAAINARVVDQFGDPTRRSVRLQGAGLELSGDTDELGAFRFGGLPSGRYAVTVVSRPRQPGIGPADAEPSVVDLGTGAETDLILTVEEDLAVVVNGRTVSVSGPSTSLVADRGAGQEQALDATPRDRNASVRGRVKGPEGRPVGGAYVSVVPTGPNRTPSRATEQIIPSMTDSDGAYELTGLAPGNYRVLAVKITASLLGEVRPTVASLRDGQALDGADITLERTSGITGTIVDAYGEPMEGVTVQLWQRRTGGGRALLLPVPGVASRRTDDRGRYRLFGAIPGSFYVVATDAATRVYHPGTATIAEALPVRIERGRDTAAVDVTFVETRGGRIQGFAVDAAGQPVKSPVVLVDSHRSGFPTPAQRTAAVAADGSFTFSNVPPGDYVVQATVGTDSRPEQFGMQYVTVTEGEAPPLVVRTLPGTRLSGRIRLEGDTSAISFNRFGLNTHVTDWDYAKIGSTSPPAVVLEDGAFEMTGLHGSKHLVGSAPEGWWLKSVDIAAVDASEQPFPFGAGGQSHDNVVATFADTGAEIGGGVRAGGQPAVEYSVLIFSTDRNRWWAPSGYVRLARPAPDGRFRVASLPPGDYYIAAVDRFDIDTEWLDAEVLVTLAPVAGRIVLRDRQKLTTELDLIRRAR